MALREKGDEISEGCSDGLKDNANVHSQTGGIRVSAVLVFLHISYKDSFVSI